MQNSKTPPAFRVPLSAFVALALILASLLGSSAPAAVIISEIMYNPYGTDLDTTATPDIYREWAELYNTDPTPIDISGWTFGDAHDNQWATPFPAGTTLGGHQALVVTGNSSVFDANWGAGINRIQVGSFPILANTPSANDETPAIRNAAGEIHDQLTYDDENGWPGTRPVSGRDGTSIFLKPAGLSTAGNDVGANWQISSQGAYGARYVAGGGEGENHGSPGVVVTQEPAPFVPSPDAAWSMVVMPDTQNYVKDTIDLPILSQLTTWIRDNREAYNIQAVLQEGDIVNQNSQVTPTSGDQTADEQWANAREGFSILDGHVPYILAVGNHDLGSTSAQSRSTQLNDYFNASQNPLTDPAQGGILGGTMFPGRLENAYYDFTAPDGREMLIFSLEFWPRQATVDWANSVASHPDYENHTAVLLTHAYLEPNNTRSNDDGSSYGVGAGGDFNDGEQLWHEMVKFHGNFEMTFNGHVGGDQVGYLQSIGVEGNPVHQMVFNSQFEINGGNGWIRIVEFLQDGTTMRVRTYSPFLDMYRTDPENQFELTLSPLPPLEGDFDGDRDVDGEDLAAWQAGYGVGNDLADGDADGDNDVDGADFLTWQRNVTSYAKASFASNAVPEPTTFILAGLLAACGLATRHHRVILLLALGKARRRFAQRIDKSVLRRGHAFKAAAFCHAGGVASRRLDGFDARTVRDFGRGAFLPPRKG